MKIKADFFTKLMSIVDDVLDSEDDTGCCGEITVIDSEALIKLRNIRREIRSEMVMS